MAADPKRCISESDLGSIEKPVLVVYSPNDKVVNAQEIERRYALFGTKLKALRPITQSVNRDNHVLAGDILAASNTRNVEEIILDFISKLP